MARALITGGSGFVGQWMARELLRRNWDVFAGTISGVPAPGVLSHDEVGAVRWLSLDILADQDVDRAVAASEPAWIIHLAGIASPTEANALPLLAMQTNGLGALRLLAAVARRGTGTRVLVVGSAEQYGAHTASENPLPESAAQAPLTVYGASKAAQEIVALQSFRASGVPVICTRSFNHSGPGHARTYLLPSLISRARAIGARGGALTIGNGTPVRDYLHVRDVVRAYALLLERGEPGEVYNVSSGQGTTVSELARLVLKRMGVTADISSDPALVRRVDTPVLVGDNSKLRSATGWSPEFTTEDIIDDLLHATTL